MAFNLENIPDDYGAVCARCGGKEQKRENKKPSTRASRKKAAKRVRERRAEAKAEKIQEPVDVQYQFAKFKREHPEWRGNDAVGACPSYGKSKADVSAQPKKSAPKKCVCRIVICWTRCKRNAHKSLRADLFPSLDAAEFAAAEYKACHGWAPFVSFCEQCSAFHLFRDRPLVT